MASYFPLIVNSDTGTINELPSGDVLNLAGSNIANIVTTTSSNVILTGGVANLANTSSVDLGAIANLHVAGGSTGQYLQTNGSGTLNWATISASSISNGTSNVSMPSANGNVNLSAAGTANVLVVTGTGANINGTARITGTATLTGNASFTGANITFSDINKLHIPGGSSGQVLTTDGAGSLYWGTGGGGGGGGGSSGVGSIQQFSAFEGQTVYTVTGGYSGAILVFVNGLQIGNTDYSATDDTTIVLTTPSTAGDIIRVIYSMPALRVNDFDSYALAMSIVMGA